MATASVETLLIKIGADVADLKKGLDDANKNLNKFETDVRSSINKASASFTAAIGQMGRALVAVVAAVVAAKAALDKFGSSLERMDALQRMSAQTGVAISRLDELTKAAELAGVPFEVLQQAITGFQQRLAEGLSDRLSAVSLALNTLGINARDTATGGLRSFDDILPQIAEHLSQYSDGLGKAQIASALFGEEAGPRMLRLLNQGAEGIRRFIEEARRSGTVTQEQSRRAEEYRQATVAMQQSIDSLVRELATRLAPAVVITANAITQLINLLPRAAEEERGTAAAVESLRLRMEAQRLIVDQLAAAEARWMEQGRRSTGIMRQQTLAAQQQLELLRELWSAERTLMAIRESGERAEEARRRPAPGMADQRLAAQEAISEAQHQLSILQERMTGQRSMFDQLNTDWNAHATIVEEATRRINVAYQTQGDKRRALANIERQLERQHQQQMLDTATLAASTITAVFGKNKTAAIAAAIINTAVGITRALSTLLPPWSWIQAGLIAATGAAQIATIRSTTESGGGNTPSVGGGGAQTPEQGEPSRMLTISGIRPDDLFSGEMLRGLIGRISDEVANNRVTLISTRTA